MALDPLISVIIPVYNGERHVSACIEMMLRQTYARLEIIIVDDGSKDTSVRLATSYPVSIIQFKENRGLSAARNAGLKAASGKYIHFMDVDDVINDKFYEELLQAIEAYHADVACAGMIHEKKVYKSILFKHRKVYTKTYDKLKATYVGKLGYVWRYLFRIEFLKKNKLCFEEGRFIEDMMFSLPAVYLAEELVVVPDAVYTYVYNQNSIMTNKERSHAEKRRLDRKHSAKEKRAFALKNQIKIPGVNAGVANYVFKKLYCKLGYKLFGKKFIIH